MDPVAGKDCGKSTMKKDIFENITNVSNAKAGDLTLNLPPRAVPVSISYRRSLLMGQQAAGDFLWWGGGEWGIASRLRHCECRGRWFCYFSMSMKLLVWNIRGTAKSSATDHIKKITREYKVDVIILLETRLEQESVAKLFMVSVCNGTPMSRRRWGCLKA